MIGINEIPGPYFGAKDINGVIHWNEYGFSESGLIGKDKIKSGWEKFKENGDKIVNTWGE